MKQKKSESHLVTIEYENPIRIYDRASEYLFKTLSKADMGNLLKLISLPQMSMNMLCYNEIPHTNQTLQQHLKMKSESGFMSFMKRLKEQGVVYSMKQTVQDKSRVVYIMNPYFCNRGQELQKMLFTIFEDFPTVNK